MADEETTDETETPEPEANAAHGFEHPLGRALTILLVIVVRDAGRENNQRQRGARDQKGETHWQ